MLEIIIDTLFKALEGLDTISAEVLYILKALEFMMNPILPFLIFKLFESNNSSKLLKCIKTLQLIIIYANIALQIVSLFGNYMFTIDENNLYHRTDITTIYLIAVLSSTALMVLSMYIFSQKAQNTNLLTLIGICLLLIIGIALRGFNQNSNFDWLCVSISFFVIDIFYVDASLRLDPLTHLLNRQVFTTITGRINFSTAIIYIDANYLKKVNDTFGHECGDKTLQSIAKCIRKTYSDYAWCFRIGGDEFCVILKPESFKTLVDSTPRSNIHTMAENLMKKMDEKIAHYAEKDGDSYLLYGVSQGYDIYYAPNEYPSITDKKTIEDVIRIADEMMLACKKEYKEKFSKENPSSDLQEQTAKNVIKRLNSAN